eukprot:gene11888-13120_t
MGFLHWPVVSWIWSLFKIIFGLLSRLWCRSRKQSSNNIVNDSSSGSGQIHITIGGNNINENIHSSQRQFTTGVESNFVDWNNWQDNPTGADPNHDDAQPGYDNLFEDMEPKLTRPKMVRVSKPTGLMNQKGTHQSRLHVDANNINIQGWNDELIEESQISEEARSMLKEKRRADKQRRADEQRRKKEEHKQMRMEKKGAGHLGIKVN